MILLVNACVRKESRTYRLAKYVISKLLNSKSLNNGSDNAVKEVRLSDISFPPVDQDYLDRRDKFIMEHDYSDPMFDFAGDFASADIIVIASPFWDLSFPAVLKQYFEQITVSGLTFSYGDDGVPQGLCRAKRLYYVTTAGGTIYTNEYGFGYIKGLASAFYGIPETTLIKAEGLDIQGADVEQILKDAEKQADELIDSVGIKICS